VVVEVDSSGHSERMSFPQGIDPVAASLAFARDLKNEEFPQ